MKEIALTTLNIKILFNILIYLIYNTRYSSSSECYYKHIYASMSNSIPTSQLNYVKKHLLEPRKFGRRGQRSAGENVPGEKSGGKELFVLFYTLYTLMHANLLFWTILL